MIPILAKSFVDHTLKITAMCIFLRIISLSFFVAPATVKDAGGWELCKHSSNTSNQEVCYVYTVY